jgi:ankyrin repeat protein
MKHWPTSRRHSHSIEIVKLLLQHGADVNIKSTCDLCKTPFHSSIVELTDLKTILYEHVEDINVCDNEGHSPLFWAITANDVEAFKLLLSHPDTILT